MSSPEDNHDTQLESPASARVINNEDLMHTISAFAKDTPRAAFVPLLLVNWSFFHAIVGSVWDSIPSFLPLFRLLPSFTEADTGPALDGIQNDDWTRWQIYSKYIRHVVLVESCPLEHLSEGWLSYFMLKSATSPLLPRVTSISCQHGAAGCVRLLPLAMGATLKEINVALRSYPFNNECPDDWEDEDGDVFATVRPLLATVARLAPNLQSLSYTGPFDEGIARAIAELRKLPYLNLTITCPIAFTDFAPISQLSLLETLHIQMFHDPTSDDVHPVDGALPKLSHFQAKTTSRALYGLNTLFAARGLKRYQVQLTAITSENANFGDVLINNPGLATFAISSVPEGNLQEFWMEDWSEADQTQLLDALVARVRILKAIHIVGFALFTDAMVDLARTRLLEPHRGSALTSLRFHIPSVLNADELPGWTATPQTLIDFAASGSKTLTHLALHFAADAFNQVPALPTDIPTHGLESLWVITDNPTVNFSIHQKIAVATFLEALFPSLMFVRGTAMDEWEEVNALVYSYRQRGRGRMEAV